MEKSVPDQSNLPPDERIQISLEQLEVDLKRVKSWLKMGKDDGLNVKQSGLSELSPTSRENGANKIPEEGTGEDTSESHLIRRRNGQKQSKMDNDNNTFTVNKHRGHRTTLAVISLDTTPVNTDEDGETPIILRPPTHQNFTGPAEYMENNNNNNNSSSRNKANRPTTTVESEYCCFWPFSLLQDRPILRLFCVMTVNGLLSMICAALIMEIEAPAQRDRIQVKADLQKQINLIKSNLTAKIMETGTEAYDKATVMSLLHEFDEKVPKVHKMKAEIKWNMLSAQAFITSVQTTTGYGDIIPVTFWGKFFTIGYASLGIPIFMWYIVKLGVVFRVVVMKFIFYLLQCCCPMHTRSASRIGLTTASADPYLQETSSQNSRNRPKPLRLISMTNLSKRFTQQYYDDKRFHPSIIGVILLIFLCSVAIFISKMEGISYFDAFYASFITYSTIGFGDIDIFKISYRSNWFNLLIYGNFIHIVGYMILSAWVSSILEKFGVRKF